MKTKLTHTRRAAVYQRLYASIASHAKSCLRVVMKTTTKLKSTMEGSMGGGTRKTKRKEKIEKSQKITKYLKLYITGKLSTKGDDSGYLTSIFRHKPTSRVAVTCSNCGCSEYSPSSLNKPCLPLCTPDRKLSANFSTRSAISTKSLGDAGGFD